MLLVSPTRWWVLVVQGLLNLTMAFVGLFYEGISHEFMVYSWGLLFCLQGLVGLLTALRERHFLQNWWMSGIIALVNLGMGVYVFIRGLFFSLLSLNFLTVFIGIQALVQGGMGFGISLEMRREFNVKSAYIFFGILSLAGGILVLTIPYTHIFELASLVSVYALLSGLGQILDSLRLKKMAR